ncbi:protein FAR1-RELATED SEQUENCE 5-like [Lotus japonicus]|uniref:protein FAR1-RELATED SEQUENCE 5-like n=1 Tax=Lotus japonicus TaxID=34305 RepID=UPI002585B74D|nr:protein FAR1-RELATED SEQUENCE 5-like [Lotus japonicus]
MEMFKCKIKSRTIKNKVGDVIQQTLVCFREGKRKDYAGHAGEKRKQFPKKDTRCECKAHCMLHVLKVDNRWHVKSVCDEQNHVLVGDDLIGLAPAHRRMDEADITQLNCYRMSGISTPKAYGVFANQMGGYQNEKDADLIWKHTYDEDRRLDKLFWSDGCSRDNYSLFGDVLAFDATYKKNKYKRPLMIFSGVYPHNQTIIFAAALVSNEQEDTYVWLLQNLLDAMHEKFPVSVITDGDPAIKKAIRKVLPNAHHRLCAWHLLRNAVSNVVEPKFIQMFTRCMLCDLEVAKFEKKFAEMVIECGCQDNVWVQDLYAQKKMWATAHMRGEFFAGSRTTSRVEGLHAQVGRYHVLKENCRRMCKSACRAPKTFRETNEIVLKQARKMKKGGDGVKQPEPIMANDPDRYLRDPLKHIKKHMDGAPGLCWTIYEVEVPTWIRAEVVRPYFDE